ncbi:type I-E CRISPR-associated protein Cse2/CasB [Thermobifida halotolerans]|uniref:Type I-E CRISPR-associated protein Cse2/CasB n=1 Tax=Thermobifida halotolerans TaxID=483545 RepID=A0A399G5M3_9ACTN|nr:type I-E CRISPR-associated protein Cse2/CasB [Thermobifida halotolerans]UOE20827.1 type I-E CRISPR-associated protein Cse2/CasB [Thermobifida halotolerans]
MNSKYVLHQADALVQRVSKLVVEDPAARAALRRGVGLAPDDPRMLAAHRIVAPYVPEGSEEGRRGPVAEWEAPAVERAFYAVAAIMAAQPRSARDQGAQAQEERRDGEVSAETPSAEEGSGDSAAEKPQRRPNLGVSLAEAAFAKGLNADTTEQRLHLLARQNLDGVHRHLPRLVLHLRGDAVDIDWGVLTRDLARWGHSPRRVAKEWVQSYHRTLETLRREAARAKNDTATEETEAA